MDFHFLKEIGWRDRSELSRTSNSKCSVGRLDDERIEQFFGHNYVSENREPLIDSAHK
jgi:hypothetical protein